MALVLAFALITIMNTQAQAQGSAKALFLKNQCNRCHSLSAQHIKRLGSISSMLHKPPDLSHVGKIRNATWIVGWLEHKNLLHGKKHLKIWKGTPAETQQLANWLASMK